MIVDRWWWVMVIINLALRRIRAGWARAGRLVDELLNPPPGAHARSIDAVWEAGPPYHRPGPVGSMILGEERRYAGRELPISGDAQGRDGGCGPSDSRPAPGADMTGPLSPRTDRTTPAGFGARPGRAPDPEDTWLARHRLLDDLHVWAARVDEAREHGIG